MEEQIIFVTGAASGIGFATATACARHGATVILADRDADGIGAAAAGLGDKAHPIALHITDEQAVRAAMAPYQGRLTGAVNSAGIGSDQSALDTDIDLFRQILDVNLIGSFIVAREAALAMHPDGGSIVNISSVSGLRGNIGRTAYGASKGGVETLTKVMATELAERNIRVNAVAPGPIETPMTRKHHTAVTRRGWQYTVPLKRYGTPEDVAGAAVFLLDGQTSGYVTGHTLCVDGGFTAAGIIAT